MNAKEKTVEKVKTQPSKAGAKKPSSKAKALEKQRNKLKQTGRIEDALALIMQ